MTRTKMVIVLAAVAELAFGVPFLVMRMRHRPKPHDTPSAEAAVAGGLDSAGGQGAAGAPALPSGITGEARAAGQALLDKMLGRHNEMSAWAESERTRIKALETEVAQLEQQVKDADARAAEMSRKLEAMRADPNVNATEYETLRTSYNDVVIDQNQLVEQYNQKYGDYATAARELDAKIAEYERGLRSLGKQ